jgi:acyl-CoA dehydrogenase
MFNSLYQELDVFIESAHKLIKTRFEPNLKKWEEEGFFPNSVFTDLGAAGYLGILIPEEYGGIGGDFAMAAAWCEVFGTLCDVGLTTAVNMHSLVIIKSIATFGSPEQKHKILPKAVSGELIGAYAFTEPSAGSDLKAINTKANKTANGWILNGSKTFITNGARADFILVLAKTDSNAGYNGFTTFIVDTNLPGFKVSRKLDKLGWRSSDTAELVFENLELSEDAVLGGVGLGWQQSTANLNWERLMLTLLSLSGMRECYKQALKYSSERFAYGTPLIDISAIKDYLREARRRIALAEAITYSALKAFLSEKECKFKVSQAKRQVCEDAIWIADKAIQIHGGYGYTKEFSPERWWRDLRLMTIGGGTSEIMGNIANKLLFSNNL